MSYYPPTKYRFIAVGHGMTLEELIEEFDFSEMLGSDVSLVRRQADEDKFFYQLEVTWWGHHRPEIYEPLAKRIRENVGRSKKALFGKDHEIAMEFMLDNWERLA